MDSEEKRETENLTEEEREKRKEQLDDLFSLMWSALLERL